MTHADPVGAIAIAYQGRIREELDARLAPWTVDLSRREVHETVGSLLARQVSLVYHMAQSPGIWNGHVAPIILRTMADTFITLAWILGDPDVRAKRFILHGLGQLKLNLEHRANQLTEDGQDPDVDPVIKTHAAWLRSQRFPFLTEVNLGSWSGVTTRQMAEESGVLDFYRYVYTPFSGATHSMWHHVGIYNLVPCDSPLHRHHGSCVNCFL